MNNIVNFVHNYYVIFGRSKCHWILKHVKKTYFNFFLYLGSSFKDNTCSSRTWVPLVLLFLSCVLNVIWYIRRAWEYSVGGSKHRKEPRLAFLTRVNICHLGGTGFRRQRIKTIWRMWKTIFQSCDCKFTIIHITTVCYKKSYFAERARSDVGKAVPQNGG